MKTSLAAVPLLACISSCSSPGLDTHWRDPAFSGGTFRKVAVFVLAKEQGVREYGEDRFARRLPPGTEAEPSYRFLKGEDAGKRAVIEAQLKGMGFDGALVTRLISVDRTAESTPRDLNYQAPYINGFTGYFDRYGGEAAEEGKVSIITDYNVESLLFSVVDGKLGWSGTSTLENPKSSVVLLDEVVDRVTAQLVVEGLVGSGKAGERGSPGAAR